MIEQQTGLPRPGRLPPPQAVELAARLTRQKLEDAPRYVAHIARHLALSSGKGIRTVFLAGCAVDSEGLVSPEAAKAASAIELLHMASLVHDDIIDDAATRRGLPSVQSAFGKRQAVIAGDWLLSCALRMAISVEYPGDSPETVDSMRGRAQVFSRALADLSLGELAQNAHNGDLDLTPAQYLRIVAKKTAALFSVSAFAGGLLGECGEPEARLLLRFGRYLGIVFQIVDDLKDYLLDTGDALKPVKNDLVCGVITLPTIFGLMQDPSLRPLALEAIGADRDLSALHTRIRQSGGIEQSRQVAGRYARKADSLLQRLDNPVKREILAGLMKTALGAVKPA